MQSKSRGSYSYMEESKLWRRLLAGGAVPFRNSVRKPVGGGHSLTLPPGMLLPATALDSLELGEPTRASTHDYSGGTVRDRDPRTGTFDGPGAGWQVKGRVVDPATGSPRFSNTETDVSKGLAAGAYEYSVDLDSRLRPVPPPLEREPRGPKETTRWGVGVVDPSSEPWGGTYFKNLRRARNSDPSLLHVPLSSPLSVRAPPLGKIREGGWQAGGGGGDFLPNDSMESSSSSSSSTSASFPSFSFTGRERGGGGGSLASPLTTPSSSLIPIVLPRVLSPQPPSHIPLTQGGDSARPTAGLSAVPAPLHVALPSLSSSLTVEGGERGEGRGRRSESAPPTPTLSSSPRPVSSQSTHHSRPPSSLGTPRPPSASPVSRPASRPASEAPVSRPVSAAVLSRPWSSSPLGRVSGGGGGGVGGVGELPGASTGIEGGGTASASIAPTAPPTPTTSRPQGQRPSVPPFLPFRVQGIHTHMWTPRTIPHLQANALGTSTLVPFPSTRGSEGRVERPLGAPHSEWYKPGIKPQGRYLPGPLDPEAAGAGERTRRSHPTPLDTTSLVVQLGGGGEGQGASPFPPTSGSPALTSRTLSAIGSPIATFHTLNQGVLQSYRDHSSAFPADNELQATAPSSSSSSPSSTTTFPYTGRPAVTPHTHRSVVGGTYAAHQPPIDTSGAGILGGTQWNESGGALLTATLQPPPPLAPAPPTLYSSSSSSSSTDFPQPPPSRSFRAGIATQGFPPLSLTLLEAPTHAQQQQQQDQQQQGQGVLPTAPSLVKLVPAAQDPRTVRFTSQGMGDLHSAGDMLGSPYGYTSGGGKYLRTDWETLAPFASRPPSDTGGSAPLHFPQFSSPSPHRALHSLHVGAVFSPMRSTTPQPLSHTVSRNDREGRRDYSRDRLSGHSGEVAASGRAPGGAAGGGGGGGVVGGGDGGTVPSPMHTHRHIPASAASALRKRGALSVLHSPFGSQWGNGFVPLAPSGTDIPGGGAVSYPSLSLATGRHSKDTLNAVAAAPPAGKPSALQAQADREEGRGGSGGATSRGQQQQQQQQSGEEGGGVVDGLASSSTPTVPTLPLNAMGRGGDERGGGGGGGNGGFTLHPLIATKSGRFRAQLNALPAAGNPSRGNPVYPPGAVPFVAITDVHAVSDYTSSTLGIHQASMDDSVDEERWRESKGRSPPWTAKKWAAATASHVLAMSSGGGSGGGGEVERGSSVSVSPPPPFTYGYKKTDVHPPDKYAVGVLGKQVMREEAEEVERAGSGGDATAGFNTVRPSTTSPRTFFSPAELKTGGNPLSLFLPASRLPKSARRAAQDAEFGRVPLILPVDYTKPPPLHSHPSGRVSVNTSLDGGSTASAAEPGVTIRSPSRQRADRFRAGQGAASALSMGVSGWVEDSPPSGRMRVSRGRGGWREEFLYNSSSGAGGGGGGGESAAAATAAATLSNDSVRPSSTFGSGRSASLTSPHRPNTAPTELLITTARRGTSAKWSTLPKTYGAALAVMSESLRDQGVSVKGYGGGTIMSHRGHIDGKWKESLR